MYAEQQQREDLVAALSTAVPAGRSELTAAEVEALMSPTAALIDIAGQPARDEYQRFQKLTARGLALDVQAVGRMHAGKTVMVTGGTGCIGSTLLGELEKFMPHRLVSLSRGITAPHAVVDGVEYRHADVRCASEVGAIFRDVQPDIVYHLAAQHDPGLAEVEVARTLSTNITGSAVVMRACREHGATIIHASTGKALRPLSRDIYAASKKAAEWVLADTMRSGELVGVAARFTHVVDNSIIAERLQDWTDSGAPIRLHSPHVSFYLQSAREAAHLLMCAGLDAAPGPLRVGAIRDLGWPISLMDLALGWLGSIPHRSPVYVCGFEAGYEVAPYPGLYDPRLSGDLSPLFNAMEAPTVVESSHSDNVELCTLAFRDDLGTRALVDGLTQAAAAGVAPAVLRTMLGESGWAMWSSAVRAIPTTVLERHLAMTRSIPAIRFTADDTQVLGVVQDEFARRTHDRGARQTATRHGSIGADRMFVRSVRDSRHHGGSQVPMLVRVDADTGDAGETRGRWSTSVGATILDMSHTHPDDFDRHDESSELSA